MLGYARIQSSSSEGKAMLVSLDRPESCPSLRVGSDGQMWLASQKERLETFLELPLKQEEEEEFELELPRHLSVQMEETLTSDEDRKDIITGVMAIRCKTQEYKPIQR